MNIRCDLLLYILLCEPLQYYFIRVFKVPILKGVNFGKVKLWDVEHFWTDFDLSKGRDRTDHAFC